MAARDAAMLIDVARRRFTVDEFWRMAEAGLFREQPRVELVDGEIIDMTPIGRRHALCVGFLVEWLAPRLTGRALLLPQVSLRLGSRTECQPDLVLVRPPRAAYRDANPTPRDVLLLVEVADTSLGYDQQIKLPLDAEAGIPEVWIIDLVNEVVHVHRDPAGDRYHAVAQVDRGGTVAPAALPDLALSIDALLG
jgi:Uma2 family endonuclease